MGRGKMPSAAPEGALFIAGLPAIALGQAIRAGVNSAVIVGVVFTIVGASGCLYRIVLGAAPGPRKCIQWGCFRSHRAGWNSHGSTVVYRFSRSGLPVFAPGEEQ